MQFICIVKGSVQSLFLALYSCPYLTRLSERYAIHEDVKLFFNNWPRARVLRRPVPEGALQRGARVRDRRARRRRLQLHQGVPTRDGLAPQSKRLYFATRPHPLSARYSLEFPTILFSKQSVRPNTRLK